MKNAFDTIVTNELGNVTGGAGVWDTLRNGANRVIDAVRPYLPSPTIPLGPYTPPDPSKNRWV